MGVKQKLENIKSNLTKLRKYDEILYIQTLNYRA
jgi:hypothetical protein